MIRPLAHHHDSGEGHEEEHETEEVGVSSPEEHLDKLRVEHHEAGDSEGDQPTAQHPCGKVEDAQADHEVENGGEHLGPRDRSVPRRARLGGRRRARAPQASGSRMPAAAWCSAPTAGCWPGWRGRPGSGLLPRFGGGHQVMSWISLIDEIRAIRFLLDPDATDRSGPYNLTAPNPVTDAELTAALHAALKRPDFRWLRVPESALRRARRDVVGAAEQRPRAAQAAARGGLPVRVPDDRGRASGRAGLRPAARAGY